MAVQSSTVNMAAAAIFRFKPGAVVPHRHGCVGAHTAAAEGQLVPRRSQRRSAKREKREAMALRSLLRAIVGLSAFGSANGAAQPNIVFILAVSPKPPQLAASASALLTLMHPGAG